MRLAKLWIRSYEAWLASGKKHFPRCQCGCEVEMKSILICRSAAKVIRDEGLRCPVETGGRVAGLVRGHVVTHCHRAWTSGSKEASELL